MGEMLNSYYQLFNTFCAADYIDEMNVHNEKFVSYFNKNDMKALSELYTEDCKLMPPGSDVQEGRASNIYSGGSRIEGRGVPRKKNVSRRRRRRPR